jgi:imidazolonepropionase
VVADPAVAVAEGRVVACGPRREVLSAWEAPEVVDLGGGVLVPGFVDPHTHPLFHRTREKEFHMRMAGASYVEISKAGGGILSSIRGVREAPPAELRRLVLERYDRILLEGTTTAEVKSGYGLSTEAEIKSLEVLAGAAAEHPLETSATFLGAHEFPPEYREDREAYVELLCREMLPRARELAESADVFTEGHVYDLAQSRRYLERARELGFRLRVHADEIEPLGGAELGVELGAASVDHLVMVSPAGIEALGRSDTVAVMLPTTTFQLGKERYAPARELLEAGAVVALATDYNPGTSHVWSMPLVIAVACVKMKLTPAEALQAATINAAFSLGRDDRVGTLHPGKQADFAVLDLPSFAALGYAFASGLARWVVKKGKVVVRPRAVLR